MIIFFISTEISVLFVPIGQIGNKPPLALMMIWHQIHRKPFHDYKLTWTPTHLLVPSDKGNLPGANEF